MKKLMIATAVAAVGLSAVADVYNVKFTATTTVAASKKVKGEAKDYLKKGSVVVNGLYDTNTDKYYFWTGSGAKMVPVQNAIFEAQNGVDMDSCVNGKNVALNAGFYVGEENELGTAFVAAGLGKVLTVGGQDLNSASGSFAGKYEGNPAYGTWAWSKNASATKKGVEVYIADLLKKTEYTLEAFGNKSAELKNKLDAWREVAADAVANAEQVKKDLEEIAGLKADLADKTLNVEELENTKLELENAYGVLEKDWNDQKVQIAEQDKTIADQKEQLDMIDGALDKLATADRSVVKLLNEYLAEVKDNAQAEADQATALTNTLAMSIADWKVKTENFNNASEAFEKAVQEWEAAKEERAKALTAQRDAEKYLAFVQSVGTGDFYTQNAADQVEQTAKIAEEKATLQQITTDYDNRTNNIVKVDLPAYKDALIAETNTLTKAKTDAETALTDAQNAYKGCDYVKYTTEDNEPNWSKWAKDNDLADGDLNLKLNFFNVVYPQFKAEGDTLANNIIVAEDNLKLAQDNYDAKVPVDEEILDILAKGEFDKMIQDLLDTEKDAYELAYAIQFKEVEKAEAKLTDLKALYDKAMNLSGNSEVEANKAVEEAKEAYTKASAAQGSKKKAMEKAEEAKNEAEAEYNAAVAIVQGILGVDPKTEEVYPAQQKYNEDIAYLRDISLQNVAAAEALLARLSK